LLGLRSESRIMERCEKVDSQDRMSERAPWDWPPDGNWPPERLERDRRGVYRPASYRCQRRPVGFGTSLLIVAVATVIALRWFWPAAIMLFAFTGVTECAYDAGGDNRAGDPRGRGAAGAVGGPALTPTAASA
jgi:hypothetical protein